MEKSIVICKSFTVKDPFIKATVEDLVKPGHLYQVIKEEDGMHLVLNEDGLERFLYMHDLKHDKDNRIQYEFIEVNPQNILNAISLYPEKHIEFLTSEDNPVQKFREEMMGMREINDDVTDEDGVEPIYSVSDEEFLLEVYEDLKRSDLPAAEGLIASFEFTSEAWNALDSIPKERHEAIDKAINYMKEFKRNDNGIDLGLAQLMLYYIFSLLNNDK